MFAAMSFFMTLFAYLAVPETKGECCRGIEEWLTSDRKSETMIEMVRQIHIDR